ncbi:MAG: M14 family zinc carboxypeptidase [Planctomycetota bacterium]|nr:M14 family zinc carboxypeptidase [Planctomycetota bacterium]
MSSRRILVGLLSSVLMLAAVTAQQAAPIGESLRVQITGGAGLAQALSDQGVIGDHVQVHQQGAWHTATAIVGRDELRSLRAALPPGTLFMVLEQSRPYSQIAAAGAAAAQFYNWPGYHTRAEVVTDLQALEQGYPSLCKLYDLQSRYGAPLTHDGFRIYALRISNAPDQDQDKPNLVLSANTHANELAVIEVPLYAAEQLLQAYGNDPQLTQLIDENQIWILPNLNPDGLEYTWNSNNLWRKNRRDNGDGSIGVDMNRNYPFFWSQCGSSNNTGSNTYHGTGPASEPEIQALLMFAEVEGFERLLDFHCQGPDIRHPYNNLVENAIPAAVRATMDPIQNAIANAMGYPPVGTCCCGTLMEWHFSTKGTMSFLVEFATCTNPYAQTAQELIDTWPGVVEHLTTPVPMRGHVTSANGGAPLQASITIAGHEFQDGQTVMSGGRFGRYHLWAGPGTFDVTFAADGHLPQTVQVNLVAGQTLTQDIILQDGNLGTHATFGAGCPGSVVLPGACASINAAGGQLDGHQSNNEYCYQVDATSALTVTGFRLFTQAGGNFPVMVAAALYRADQQGEPEDQPVASGVMTVDPQPGFYEVTLNVPVNVQAGETFFIGSDTGTVLTSTLTSGTPGVGYWRRPPQNPNWSMSNVVDHPSYEVLCQGAGQPGGVPSLTADGVPSLGVTFEVELAGAVANAAALLVLGNSDAVWQGAPLPFSLAALGAPGCELLVSGDATQLVTTDGNGEASVPISVPNVTALLDAAFYEQFAVLDPAANSLGFAFSNAGAGVVGH